MTDYLARLTAALADRYTIERELGAGGMGPLMSAEVSGSTRMDVHE
jgi:hypothetical protein